VILLDFALVMCYIKRMKIFVISDTHDRIITPPSDCEVSIHLGDAVNYFNKDKSTAQAHISVFRAYNYSCVGNHENMLLSFQNDPLLRKILDDESWTWLRQLRHQPTRKINIEGIKIRLSHYIIADPVDIAGEAANEPFAVLNIAKAAEFDVVAYGHTHEQFEQRIGGVWFLNPGDGEQGEYAVITTENSKIISIELKTL